MTANTALWFVFTATVLAQTPETVLTFNGSPLSIPYACTNEDLEWAGLTCTDEPCPIYAELTSAAGRGHVVLVAGNLHAANATLYSVLLRSDDGGKTWREPVARIRGATLEKIEFLDANTIAISGESLQPLPIDAFFLLSGDGGKSWEHVPLFEAGTPGGITQFTFDSKDHGLALVDHGGGDTRYELLESNSGGHEWNVRERSDSPPKLSEPSSADWRLRAEAKRYRLEKMDDGRWTPFASFLVAAAKCKEQPPPEPSEASPAAPDTNSDGAVSELRLGTSQNTTKKTKPRQ